MNAVIAGIVISCYALAWLFTARLLYGRWRAKEIDRKVSEYPYSYPTTARAISSWNEIDRGPVMFGALAVGLLWPLAPTVLLLIRFMNNSPVLSQAEMRDRIAERDRRIAELEREAGIGPG